MVFRAGTLMLALATVGWPAEVTLAQALSRVAEEAEVFQQNIPRAITREVLVQRTLLPPPHFAVGASVGPRVQTRELISEYSVGPLRQGDAPVLVELRQTVSVDGRPIQADAEARHALSLDVRSPDERIRKRMLEAFSRYGLVDVATEYGIILLAFTKRGLARMETALAGEAWVGAEQAYAIQWRQASDEGGELAFHGRRIARQRLEGVLWVRKSDGLPLRIRCWAEYPEGKRTIRDDATVDYVRSPHGFLAPASVAHRHMVNGSVITENLFLYEPFRLFSSDAEIKFTEVPDPAGKKK